MKARRGALYPAPRLASAALISACAVTTAAFLGLGELAATTLALVAAPVAVADLLALWRRPPPVVRRPAELRAVAHRPLEVEIDIDACRGLRAAALGWPAELGGPLEPIDWLDGAPCLPSWECLPARRGRFRAGPIWLRLDSPLRLWSRRFIADPPCSVDVAPDPRGPEDDAPGRDLLADGRARARAVGASGHELYALRPWTPGDDRRRVDWKATARRGQPMVRESLPERRRAVLLAIDGGRAMRAESSGESKLDVALRAAARVALVAERHGDATGVLLYTDRVVRFVPPTFGAGQAQRLLRCLADVQPECIESELSQALPHIIEVGRRAFVIVVTDVLDAGGAQDLAAAATRLSGRHTPLVTLLRDPQLDAALAAPITGRAAAYRRAAAELAASERARAVSLLRTRGVRAVDLSTRSLALQAVRGYIAARLEAW